MVRQTGCHNPVGVVMINDESVRVVTATMIVAIGESQRDSVIQPRVARQALPWVNENKFFNPNGVVANLAREENGMAATALRLEIWRTMTQGSSSSQPWALGRNPVGIRAGPGAAAAVTRRFVRNSICRIFLRISRGIMRKLMIADCRLVQFEPAEKLRLARANQRSKLPP